MTISPEISYWLPIIFSFLLGLSVLLYVILDGYDLGVGILLQNADDKFKDKMIASIGPFWDANETWLVLSIGILLVAFPKAQNGILSNLYIPTTLMIIGLILRGISFDFRVKVKEKHKHLWDKLFFIGSSTASIMQGYMLGSYITEFNTDWMSHLFSLFVGVCLSAGYSLLGSTWLIMKTTGELQKYAIKCARKSLWLTLSGALVIGITTPIENHQILLKWFTMPTILLLGLILLLTITIIFGLIVILKEMPFEKDKLCWLPFCGTLLIFLLSFYSLAFSFYPYAIPGKMTIWEAASAPESLLVIFIGVVVVLPCIIGYTIFSYKVFWGKVQDLKYY